jgi:hypothetical protein
MLDRVALGDIGYLHDNIPGMMDAAAHTSEVHELSLL